MSLARQIVQKAISSAIKKNRKVSFHLDKNKIIEYVLDHSNPMKKAKPEKPSTKAPKNKRPKQTNKSGFPVLVRTQSDRFKNFNNPPEPEGEPDLNPRQLLELKKLLR